MGIPMAKNIHEKGFTLTVYNRTPWKAHELSKIGIHEAMSIDEAVISADVVISMVTKGEDVASLVQSSKKSLKPDTIWIDMSTIGVKWAKYIAADLRSVWVHFLDAPVTGSTPKAITGELTIFIGWERAIFARAIWVLSAMGNNLQYMGATGMGQAMKLVNNTLVAYSMIGLAEVMKLAESMGMDSGRTAEVIKTIPVASAYIGMKIDNFVRHEYPLMFSVANMAKDITLAYEMMQEWWLELESLIHAKSLYDDAMRAWLSREDLSAIEKVI